jgi:YesN/AraC family two-component response regulator
MLERVTSCIDEAASGVEAIGLCEAKSYDLVITDIVMPDCDGLELIQRIKTARPGTRFLAISGAINTLNYLRTAMILGADAALPKPVSEADLIAAVQSLLPATKE